MHRVDIEPGFSEDHAATVLRVDGQTENVARVHSRDPFEGYQEATLTALPEIVVYSSRRLLVFHSTQQVLVIFTRLRLGLLFDVGRQEEVAVVAGLHKSANFWGPGKQKTSFSFTQASFCMFLIQKCGGQSLPRFDPYVEDIPLKKVKKVEEHIF